MTEPHDSEYFVTLINLYCIITNRDSIERTTCVCVKCKLVYLGRREVDVVWHYYKFYTIIL